MSISTSFLPRFFSSKSKRSKPTKVETPSASSPNSPSPLLPMHALPVLEPDDKGKTTSLESFSLSRQPQRPTAAAESFINFGPDEVVHIPRKVPSWDQLPRSHRSHPKPSRVPPVARRAVPVDLATTQCLPSPTTEEQSHSNRVIGETYDESLSRRRSSPRPPYHPPHQHHSQLPSPLSSDGQRHSMWTNEADIALHEEHQFNTNPEGQLDLLEVMHGFFQADDDRSWLDDEEPFPIKPPEAETSSIHTITKNRSIFHTTRSPSPNLRSSLSSSITARLRLNSSKRLKPRQLKDDSGSLPIHQRPLPAIPKSDSRRQSASSDTLQLQPALESPTQLPIPDYHSDTRPPSSLRAPSDCLKQIDEERRFSLPSSMKPQPVVAHIMPPEELTRIRASGRPGSISSVSSNNSDSDEKTLITPLPRSPFRASFGYPPNGLNPPPRPRGM